VTIGANDIALGSLGQDPSHARAAHHAGNPGRLGSLIAMIEVHRAGRESPTAIGARDIPQLAKDSDMFAPGRALSFQVER
jgi:hypothetical protein